MNSKAHLGSVCVGASVGHGQKSGLGVPAAAVRQCFWTGLAVHITIKSSLSGQFLMALSVHNCHLPGYKPSQQANSTRGWTI